MKVKEFISGFKLYGYFYITPDHGDVEENVRITDVKASSLWKGDASKTGEISEEVLNRKILRVYPVSRGRTAGIILETA
ncbi:MAG: hypothetical protein GXY05_00940 [Clostridiales bacterium]|nr:hypothetical protein [Clostridiales bacterium]